MTALLATLSMYDWPEVSPAIDRLWAHTATNLHTQNVDAPPRLNRAQDVYGLWSDPRLLVGQTCGWPYANRLRDTAHPFARFDYGLEGCPPGFYRSVFIGQDTSDAQYLTDADALKSCPKVAINGADSQSGFHVFAEISKLPAEASIPAAARIVSGAHRNSVIAVAEGNARIAAIDAVAFELAKAHEPEAVRKVAVIGHSIPKPGLPLITASARAALSNVLFEALSAAIEALSAQDRETLGIHGLLPARGQDYDVFLKSRNT